MIGQPALGVNILAQKFPIKSLTLAVELNAKKRKMSTLKNCEELVISQPKKPYMMSINTKHGGVILNMFIYKIG